MAGEHKQPVDDVSTAGVAHETFATAQLVDTLQVGGAEVVAVDIANTLARRGRPSHLVYLRDMGDLTAKVDPRVMIWCAERSKKLDWRSFLRVRSYLSRNRIAVAHCHGRAPAYVLTILRWLTALRCVVIFQDHFGRVAKTPRYQFLDAVLLRGMDTYYAVSRHLQVRARRLLGMTDDMCQFIPNGVTASPAPHEFTKGHTVIQVGNILPVKGHDTALRAAAILRRQVPDLRWLCVGQMREGVADYVRSLMRTRETLGLTDCVEFLGVRADVPDLLKQADVGVMTSRMEALPVSLLEYMAEGLPTVVTAVGECGSIVQAAQCGQVAAPGDAEAIAAHLQAILSDRLRAARLGEAGRAYVTQHYSLDAIVDRIEATYRKALRRRGMSAR
ncbi:MAG: glycosyltransferase family 4 protein [Planctomycetota bacterium]|jgi:glycosyltransferase involved in cell wall biosynthesis